MHDAEGYKNCFRDVTYELVEKTKDRKLYEPSEFNAGYRMALYALLSHISNQVEVFGLDRVEAGLHGFDPDRWLKEGEDYWPA